MLFHSLILAFIAALIFGGCKPAPLYPEGLRKLLNERFSDFIISDFKTVNDSRDAVYTFTITNKNGLDNGITLRERGFVPVFEMKQRTQILRKLEKSDDASAEVWVCSPNNSSYFIELVVASSTGYAVVSRF